MPRSGPRDQRGERRRLANRTTPPSHRRQSRGHQPPAQQFPSNSPKPRRRTSPAWSLTTWRPSAPASTGDNPTTAFIEVDGALVCKTSAYSPAIFTAGDDESVGDTLYSTIWAGWTGQIQPGTYSANPALVLRNDA